MIGGEEKRCGDVAMWCCGDVMMLLMILTYIHIIVFSILIFILQLLLLLLLFLFMVIIINNIMKYDHNDAGDDEDPCLEPTQPQHIPFSNLQLRSNQRHD